QKICQACSFPLTVSKYGTYSANLKEASVFPGSHNCGPLKYLMRSKYRLELVFGQPQNGSDLFVLPSSHALVMRFSLRHFEQRVCFRRGMCGNSKGLQVS